MSSLLCPCGTTKEYVDCCGVFIEKGALPLTAEQLMRSRYTAYALGHVAYILETTHPNLQAKQNEADIRRFSAENRWEKLQILATEKGTSIDTIGKVAFKAFYLDANGLRREHFENSTFKKIDNRWFYESGTYDAPQPKTSNRNEPCPCGSGKKYKKCCGV